MPTPSGTISLNDVNVELGLAGTTTISMNQTNVRSLAGVPSGAISMQNLQNKSSIVVASITISANTSNYVLDTSKVPGYSAGKTQVTLTINPSIFVTSTSTGSYAFTVDNSWTTGDTITIVNNGTIFGRGGNGGDGNTGNGNPGGGGGPALLVQRPASINNGNRISGGGGGGGGGAGWVQGTGTKAGPRYDVGIGGGGGGGIGNGTGGTAGTFRPTRPWDGYAGNPGTLTTAGSGGSGRSFSETGAGITSGSGGSGGTYGSSGGSGGTARSSTFPKLAPTPGGTGGSGGNAVNGNSFITWINTGTRNGGIS